MVGLSDQADWMVAIRMRSNKQRIMGLQSESNPIIHQIHLFSNCRTDGSTNQTDVDDLSTPSPERLN